LYRSEPAYSTPVRGRLSPPNPARAMVCMTPPKDGRAISNRQAFAEGARRGSLCGHDVEADRGLQRLRARPNARSGAVIDTVVTGGRSRPK
jgi:hypothetical protein